MHYTTGCGLGRQINSIRYVLSDETRQSVYNGVVNMAYDTFIELHIDLSHEIQFEYYLTQMKDLL